MSDESDNVKFIVATIMRYLHLNEVIQDPSNIGKLFCTLKNRNIITEKEYMKVRKAQYR